jgi:hypothetical protein
VIIVLDGRLLVLGHLGEHVDRIAARDQAAVKGAAAQKRWADSLLVVELLKMLSSRTGRMTEMTLVAGER